jgi:DNA-3-methyladenine glycosylase II
MLRWFLSLHAPSHGFSLSPNKISRQASKEVTTPVVPTKQKEKARADDVLPVFGQGVDESQENEIDGGALSPVVSPILLENDLATPAPMKLNNIGRPNGNKFPSLPPPFTPSINKTLNKGKTANETIPPLPEGLTVSVLKSRLEGKKKIKCVLLSTCFVSIHAL